MSELLSAPGFFNGLLVGWAVRAVICWLMHYRPKAEFHRR